MCPCPNDPDLIGIVATKVKWSGQPVGKSTCWNRHGWVIRILEQPPRHHGGVTVSGSGDPTRIDSATCREIRESMVQYPRAPPGVEEQHSISIENCNSIH